MVSDFQDTAAAQLAAILQNTFAGSPAGIIFDCDGVLFDSRKANIHYYNLLREGIGLPPMTLQEENYVQMSTAQQAIDKIIPAALLPLLREAAGKISYSLDVQPLLEPMPGILPVLLALKRKNILMAVHTNRLNTLEDMLGEHGMAGFFRPVVTVAKAPPKPDPGGALLILEEWNLPPEKVLFVGDSSTDQGAAGAAGIPFLAFGQTELDSLAVCDNFHVLLAAFKIIWM